MKVKYIFKKDLVEWEDKGWELCGDLFVTGCLGLDECLIKCYED